ncbi:MAG: TetR/AcrR family transcriptional regulator [Bacteroidetes bacterium]|nr:TetR/AcrR family transcriptional regulator [Bacteroidota bacterium]
MLTEEKKEIQEQRTKGYFIQAAKEILKGEGIRLISVRNIADRAGYSYATLYNYFKDLKDLIFLCVKDFQDECEITIKEETETRARGKEKIEGITQGYLKYFIQYPGIFDLFFLERMSEIGSKQKTSELIYTFFDRLCQEEWDFCVSKGIFQADEAESRKVELKLMVTGLLLFYNNRRQPANFEDFMNIAKNQLAFILR